MNLRPFRPRADRRSSASKGVCDVDLFDALDVELNPT